MPVQPLRLVVYKRPDSSLVAGPSGLLVETISSMAVVFSSSFLIKNTGGIKLAASM
jgi:hypothetical protein